MNKIPEFKMAVDAKKKAERLRREEKTAKAEAKIKCREAARETARQRLAKQVDSVLDRFKKSRKEGAGR